MALTFDPDIGLSAATTDVIRDAVRRGWSNAFSRSFETPLDTASHTPAGQLIDAQTAEIAAKDAEILFLANNFDPATAQGRFQDALASIYFLKRKIDEPTVVTCRLTGLGGTIVPYGALVKSSTGQTLMCNRAATIGDDGRTETTFRTISSGAIEIPSHTVTTIITTVPGWDTVDNPAAGATGREIETQGAFETRRAASVAANAHGTVSSLYGTLANIPGVLDVQVLENVGPFPITRFGVEVPGHGVTVCIYGGEDQDIAEAIYRKKDAGCDTGGNTPITHVAADYYGAVYDYLILRPEPVAFWVRVTLGAGSRPSEGQIAALKSAIYLDFHGLNASRNTRVGLASTVYAARFYCPASSVRADGAMNIHTIEIALSASVPSADAFAEVIDIRGDQEPTLSTDNVLVVVADVPDTKG